MKPNFAKRALRRISPALKLEMILASLFSPEGKAVEIEAAHEFFNRSQVAKAVETYSDQRPFETSDIMPQRQRTIPLRNPLGSFEANSDAVIYISETIGRGSDLLGVGLGMDDHPSLRLLQEAGIIMGNAGALYFSEEVAHHYLSRWKGQSVLKFDLNNPTWFGYPMVVTNMSTGDRSEEERTFEIVSGFNQHAITSEKISRYNQGEWKFDQATLFLMAKFKKTGHILWGPAIREDHLFNDVDEYRKAVGQSKGDLLLESVLADLGSFYHVKDSLSSVWNYLEYGERAGKTTTSNIGGFEVTPALVTHYLTHWGGLYKISSVVNPKSKNPIDVSALFNSSLITKGEFEVFTFALKYNDISDPDLPFNLSPFLYGTVRRDNESEYGDNGSVRPDKWGVSGGVDFTIPVDDLSITIRVEGNYNDPWKNDVMRHKNGLNILATVTKRF